MENSAKLRAAQAAQDRLMMKLFLLAERESLIVKLRQVEKILIDSGEKLRPALRQSKRTLH